MKSRYRILFLCTGNSCRSQMAEGWTRTLKKDRIEVYSAGTEVHGLDPLAVQVMAEVGVDISGHTAKHVDTVRHIAYDAVITVCDNARETCPFFTGAKRILHAGFQDPPAMAKILAAKGAGIKEQLDCYRQVRDEIRALVESLPESISAE